MHLKMSSGKWWPSFLGLNVLSDEEWQQNVQISYLFYFRIYAAHQVTVVCIYVTKLNLSNDACMVIVRTISLIGIVVGKRFPGVKPICCLPDIGSTYYASNGPYAGELTHWGRDKMDAISQTTFSNAFSWMKMHEFRWRFHWSLFLRFELTIFQHWFR